MWSFLKHWGIVQMQGLQPLLPSNFHFFPPCRKGWIWSGPIGVWIMKGLPGAGRGPVIPHIGGVGFWVGFGGVSLLCDACTHVSLWQPLAKSKARLSCCMYYIGKHYKRAIFFSFFFFLMQPKSAAEVGFCIQVVENTLDQRSFAKVQCESYLTGGAFTFLILN